LPTRTTPEPPQFILAGVKLNGSFDVRFSRGTWAINDFKFGEIEVSTGDIEKFRIAAENQSKLDIELGNGKGKAVIRDIEYDPEGKRLKGIIIELTEWKFA
jgi:hypothetical protein